MPDRIIGSQRHQEVAPDEWAPEVYVRTSWDAAVGLGRAYILGTGQVQLGLAGSVKLLLENPAGSGRIATLAGFTGFSTNSGWAFVVRDPTGGLPTAAPRVGLRLNDPPAGYPPAGEPPTSVLRAESGTSELTGGTATGIDIGLPNGNRFDVSPIGLLLYPGQSVGVNSSFGAATDIEVGMFVVEEPI